MTDKKAKPWFIGERAEALAGLFVLDLEPDYLGKPNSPSAPYDMIATFERPDGGLISIAIEVKGTEKPLADPFRVLLSRSQMHAVEKSNIPFVIVVVDVKTNDIGFNWANRLVNRDGRVLMTSHGRYDLPIRRNTQDERLRFREEIFGEQVPPPYHEGCANAPFVPGYA